MKLLLMFCVLLTCAISAFAQQSCGIDPQHPPTSEIINCPLQVGDVCQIPISCLVWMEKNHDYAIKVFWGETIHWVSDVQDQIGNYRKFLFKDKFERIPRSKEHPYCADSNPDSPPFDDGYPDPTTQTAALKKNAVVSMNAPYQACFKHVIRLCKGDNCKSDDKNDNIDPHIFIGGPSLSSLVGVSGGVSNFELTQKPYRTTETSPAVVKH